MNVPNVTSSLVMSWVAQLVNCQNAHLISTWILIPLDVSCATTTAKHVIRLQIGAYLATMTVYLVNINVNYVSNSQVLKLLKISMEKIVLRSVEIC